MRDDDDVLDTRDEDDGGKDIAVDKVIPDYCCSAYAYSSRCFTFIFVLPGNILLLWSNKYLNLQGANDSKWSFGQSNAYAELNQSDSKGKGDQQQQYEYLNRKGKTLEVDSLESGIQEKAVLKKNGSSSEAIASTSEKDLVPAKFKSVKTRQTQSGPLTPGVVLTHSASDRGRNSERFTISLINFIVYGCLQLC